jgi:hypothetical protein
LRLLSEPLAPLPIPMPAAPSAAAEVGVGEGGEGGEALVIVAHLLCTQLRLLRSPQVGQCGLCV